MSSRIVREPVSVRAWEMLPIRTPRPAVAPPVTPSAHAPTPAELLASARAQAEEILARTREEADSTLAAARAEADRVRADAQREGFADGHARGLDEWSEERERLRRMVEEVGQAYARFCTGQVPSLAMLAARAAERLLLEQLSLEPERVVEIVRHALEQITASTRIAVHLHPDDVEIVQRHREVVEWRKGSNVELVADSAVERGGCWIESEQGQVDATVPARIGRLLMELGDV